MKGRCKMKFSKIIFVLFIVPVLVFLAGCDKEGVTDTPKDPTKAEERVNQANQILMLHIAMLASNPDPSALDLSSANALYNEALQYNPDNLDAHFGAAITGVLTILSLSLIHI